MKIVSKFRDLLERFLSNLQALMSRPRLKAATPAQLIALALEQTRLEAGISRKEMADRISLEVGSTQFAMAVTRKLLTG